MPYYRIVVWTNSRRKPYAGIKYVANHNISAVQGLMERQARDHFHGLYQDCEVQMLAKTSTAIRKFLEKRNNVS